jgi:uncharacterized protein
MHEKIDRAVRKIKSLDGDKVRFIILYGSASAGRMKEDSDIDICVYYDDADASSSAYRTLPFKTCIRKGRGSCWKILMSYTSSKRSDKTLRRNWEPFMYDKAYETIKEFESFKRRYYDYLGIESLA